MLRATRTANVKEGQEPEKLGAAQGASLGGSGTPGKSSSLAVPLAQGRGPDSQAL